MCAWRSRGPECGRWKPVDLATSAEQQYTELDDHAGSPRCTSNCSQCSWGAGGEIIVWEIADDGYSVSGEKCEVCGPNRDPLVQTWCGPHPQRGATVAQGCPEAALRTLSPVEDGSLVLALRSALTPAAWPFQVTGSLGLPIFNSNLPDNILWSEGRCPACRQWLLTARASCRIETGELLRENRPSGVVLHSQLPEHEYIISFDGGARHRSPDAALPLDGPRAVGAGAALWGKADESGIRPCIAQVTASVPSLCSSMAAEAIGLRNGLALAVYVLGGFRI